MSWYVMRDLSRSNALHPAFKTLAEAGFTVYTPMVWKIRLRGAKRVRIHEPAIHDLLFVNSSRNNLDPVVARTATLQYRYVKGGHQFQAMTVADADMQRFITAYESDPNPIFYHPAEITPAMIGRHVKIIGGPLDGLSGNLLSVRGMRKKRLIVEIPGMISTAVEVAPEFISIINNNSTSNS